MMKNRIEMQAISFPQPTERFELDFDKIKTIEDCVLILKSFMLPRCSKIYIDNTYEHYEEMKHLAKDGSIREV